MTTIKALLEDLLNHPEISLEQVMDVHLTPGYRQRTDGVWSSRAEVAEHFAALRTIVDSVEMIVHEELSNPAQYAERHTAVINKRDGGRVLQEVYAFGSLASDNRFDRIEETTMMLEGEEGDRGIGSTRG